MLDSDIRSMISAAPAAAAGAATITAPYRVPTLSSAALTVAAQPIPAAYSPIVLAGTVRLIEFALVALTGTAVYIWHVVPIEGFQWYYVSAILGVSVLAMLAFQAADIY